MNNIIDKIFMFSSFLCLLLVVYAFTNNDKKLNKLIKVLDNKHVGADKNE